MFKLFLAALTSLSLMFGAAETVTSQPGEPFYNVKQWSVQSWNRIQQQDQAASVDVLPTEEALQDQTRDQLRDQTRDQLCGQAGDQVCDPIRDQLRDQAHDQLRLYQDAATEPLHLNPSNPWTDETPVPNSGYGPGPGTCDLDCVPAAEPGPNGNGNGNGH